MRGEQCRRKGYDGEAAHAICIAAELVFRGRLGVSIIGGEKSGSKFLIFGGYGRYRSVGTMGRKQCDKKDCDDFMDLV